MRRNWIGVLVFALALTVQVLAPGLVNVGMAQAANDAERTLSLCLNAGGESADRSQQLPGDHNQHRDGCPLCQFCCGGIAPIEARPNQVGRAPVQWTALARTVADRVLPAPPHDHSRQARAPPALP